jgi:hypothetical protein
MPTSGLRALSEPDPGRSSLAILVLLLVRACAGLDHQRAQARDRLRDLLYGEDALRRRLLAGAAQQFVGNVAEHQHVGGGARAKDDEHGCESAGSPHCKGRVVKATT